jgi:hypothetical protein
MAGLGGDSGAADLLNGDGRNTGAEEELSAARVVSLTEPAAALCGPRKVLPVYGDGAWRGEALHRVGFGGIRWV